MVKICPRPQSCGLLLGLTIAACAAIGWSSPAAAQAITEFPIPTANAIDTLVTIRGIATGPDGNLWFTEGNVNQIGRITVGGQITEFPAASTFGGPEDLTTASDGALWYTYQAFRRVDRITAAGPVAGPLTSPPTGFNPHHLTSGPDANLWFTSGGPDNLIGQMTLGGAWLSFPTPSTNPNAVGIAAGPDGALWFVEALANKIGRVTVGGSVSEFSIPTAMSGAQAIVAGPDGNLWFTEGGVPNQVGRITTTGQITEFQSSRAQSEPWSITAGLDGNLWYTDVFDNSVNSVTPGGTITRFPIPTPTSGPTSITSGPDGAIWFVEASANKIGRIQPPAGTSPLVAAVLPSSRSVQVGNTATAFATMINAGTSAANNCSITPLTAVPAGFVYQTTNPATNALTGTPNTPVDIAAGAAQTFVIAFSVTAPFAPTIVQLGFDCSGVTAAPINPGLNTLLLSGSSSPVPDIVALAATAQNDGILHIIGTTGSGAFAVATVNVGASAAITATANTGSATLPLAISLCQTDPTSGQCLASPASSVTTTISANATPTFAIFATASGTVPFSPATNRIFVQFSDASAVVRGSTSVAVQTQ